MEALFARGHFIIHIDQRSLKFPMDQRLTSTKQNKWISKLLVFDFEIKYKLGAENREQMTFLEYCNTEP